MKVAISALTPDIEGQIDPRFGRCPVFLVIDTESMETEALENPGINASGGAGIAAARLVAGKGVEAVLTGHCGPNAFEVLAAAKIKVITGVSGKVREAVDAYRQGKLSAIENPDVGGHFGMGGGGGRGGGGWGGGRGGRP
jgi:predicted Fe-Mo cluster-binding NifX family protein